MGGDNTKCNQSLHCQYHQERGHTIEDCRTLWNHLEQLVRNGKLKQFMYHPNGQGGQAGSGSQIDTSSRPPLGTISVILAALGWTGSHLSRPHGNALVVTLRIGGYDVKGVLVDQGSGAEIMYPGLYKGLKLKLEDLACYDSPLAGLEVVEVDFIVGDAYSPYTIIVARPWLHAMGAVSSTLHLKVKYSSGDQVEELVRSQSVARQYLVAAIRHQTEMEFLTPAERGL
ncbi:uncharacterized protein LOC142639852 [Castanea sativa]|uniref:uncharacterized protein LOC142639852 n=1 Tax=Castanea sativa TaxID=21020 RepID=UPI003F652728